MKRKHRSERVKARRETALFNLKRRFKSMGAKNEKDQKRIEREIETLERRIG